MKQEPKNESGGKRTETLATQATKNEERESKTARKMVQVKERGGGGEERKETLVDKPRDFENRPLSLSRLSSRTDI